ncbi:MAG: hypothetical protein AAF078_02065 [Planctomycetota bacterium]
MTTLPHHRAFRRLATAAASAALGLAATLTAAAPASAEEDRLALLRPTLDAHGGLDRWRAQRTFTYTLTGFPLSEAMSQPNTHTFDLQRRVNRIDGTGFTVAYNGHTAWSTGQENSSGLPSRFVSLGSSYFIVMPFVFADPGTIITDAGTVDYQGKPHRAINVGYETGVGASSEDAYQLLIDPQTDRLVAINHSVTEIGVERVTWGYPQWQETDGLLVPARLEFTKGWDPQNAEPGAFTEVTNVDFTTTAPDANLYEPLPGSTIDSVDE